MLHASWLNLNNHPKLQSKFIDCLTNCIVCEYLDFGHDYYYWKCYFLNDSTSFFIGNNIVISKITNETFEDSQTNIIDKSHRMTFNYGILSNTSNTQG